MKFQTVVITGGSSGIGLDLAKAYTQQGCDVVLMARNQSKLDDAVASCSTLKIRSDQKVLSYSVDVADKSALAESVERIKEVVAVPDLLILSAGIVQSVRFMYQADY